MNLVREIDQPAVGVVRQPQPAAVFDNTPSEIRGPAPSLGEHTRDILGELGLAHDVIESLIASGAARAS